MQIGANEAMYPVMGAIKWIRTYFAMLATPLRVDRRAHRPPGLDRPPGAIVSAIYLAIMAAFGIVHSPFAILALPAAVLTGMAFAAPIAAFAATQDNDVGFSALYRFGLIPLFLFSGTFFPVTQLPGWLQPVAELTPLYHGVSSAGDWSSTLPSGSALGDAGYLVALTAIGYLVARRTFANRLVV